MTFNLHKWEKLKILIIHLDIIDKSTSGTYSGILLVGLFFFIIYLRNFMQQSCVDLWSITTVIYHVHSRDFESQRERSGPCPYHYTSVNPPTGLWHSLLHRGSYIWRVERTFFTKIGIENVVAIIVFHHFFVSTCLKIHATLDFRLILF